MEKAGGTPILGGRKSLRIMTFYETILLMNEEMGGYHFIHPMQVIFIEFERRVRYQLARLNENNKRSFLYPLTVLSANQSNKMLSKKYLVKKIFG